MRGPCKRKEREEGKDLNGPTPVWSSHSDCAAGVIRLKDISGASSLLGMDRGRHRHGQGIAEGHGDGGGCGWGGHAKGVLFRFVDRGWQEDDIWPKTEDRRRRRHRMRRHCDDRDGPEDMRYDGRQLGSSAGEGDEEHDVSLSLARGQSLGAG